MRDFLLLCITLLVTSSVFALDPALIGKWKGVGGDVSDIEIRADGSATFDGENVRVETNGTAMKMTTSLGIPLEATYQISGSSLTIGLYGDNLAYERVGGAAPAAAQPAAPTGNPLAGGGNPLAARPAAPGAGKWSDGNLTITLREEGDILKGEMVIAGQTMPTQTQGKDATFYGTFDAAGATYMYSAKVNGDAMELMSEGVTYQLKRQGPPPQSSANPLAGGAASAPVPAGNWLRKPDQGFDVALPGDFFVVKEQGGVYLLGSNVTPGLIIIAPSPTMTQADIDRGATQGIQDQSVDVRPTGTARDAKAEGGSGKIVDVSGTLDGAQVQGLAGGFLGTGSNGIVILAATTAESWPKLQPFAEQAMKGVRLYAPQISDRLRQARAALSGHSLVKSFNNSTTSMNSGGYYTGVSTNSFTAWHCCASGRGRYEGARSNSFQGGGVIGYSENPGGASDGSWTLDSAGNDFRLTFKFDDGSTASWTVTVDANENVFVDGSKVKVTTDSICNQL